MAKDMNTPQRKQPYLLDTADLMALLQVSRNTITRWIALGKISAHKIEGTKKNYFLRHEIEEQLMLPHVGERG